MMFTLFFPLMASFCTFTATISNSSLFSSVVSRLLLLINEMFISGIFFNALEVPALNLFPPFPHV